MPTATEVLADAAWLPHVYDPGSDRVLFAHMPAEARRRLAFLADHKPTGSDDAVWIAGDEVRSTTVDAVPVHYVFHSAFCRSTLFVQALDALDGVAGLSEPAVLNTLQSAAGSALAQGLLRPIVRLLGRPLEGEQVVVVKPSNFANGLIPQLLGEDGTTRAVLLYGGVKAFLRSVAKKGLSGRLWARKQLAHNRQVIPLDLGMDERAFYELTDLQTAGLAWLLHLDQFNALLRDRPAQLRTLEADQMIAEKSASLTRAASLFGAEVADEVVQSVATGTLFASHAKLGGDYAQIREEQDAAATSPVTEEEVEQVAAWIEAIAGQLGHRLPLGSPLLRDGG